MVTFEQLKRLAEYPPRDLSPNLARSLDDRNRNRPSAMSKHVILQAIGRSSAQQRLPSTNGVFVPRLYLRYHLHHQPDFLSKREPIEVEPCVGVHRLAVTVHPVADDFHRELWKQRLHAAKVRCERLALKPVGVINALQSVDERTFQQS